MGWMSEIARESAVKSVLGDLKQFEEQLTEEGSVEEAFGVAIAHTHIRKRLEEGWYGD